MARRYIAMGMLVAVGLAAVVTGTSRAEDRVVICHLKDHQYGGYQDHIGPCTPEERLVGGRTITVAVDALESRHGIVQ